jgi:hypothetical protein
LAAAASARLLIAATLVFGFGHAKEDWIDRTLVTGGQGEIVASVAQGSAREGKPK